MTRANRHTENMTRAMHSSLRGPEREAASTVMNFFKCSFAVRDMYKDENNAYTTVGLST